MRELLYVPIIHSESDLGSLGAAIDERSASLYGEKRWAEHKETVARFWQSVAHYLLSLDRADLKIYQDGLAVDGELGRRVIEEAARRGSQNHQIILELVRKGAEIRKTEDVAHLLEEHEGLVKLTHGEPTAEKMFDYAGYTRQKQRLTEERDRFIASRINETLREGETAILFIGAYHDVLPYLAEDIVVEWVKERDAVRAYFRELVSGRDESRYRQLVGYLTSPVAGPDNRERREP